MTTDAPSSMNDPVSLASRVRGTFLGGAVGDALGAAVEFDTIERIRERFGPGGVTELEIAYGHRGAITDDTQMTLFTAEGLMRVYVRDAIKGICHPPSIVDHAYARWLSTQGYAGGRRAGAALDGWLIAIDGLHARRAPGSTCVSALHADRMGTMRAPLNDSKGCGGVMRVAPAGLLPPTLVARPFELGCEIAALTHGHPSGYLAAGALAEIVNRLVFEDVRLDAAVDAAMVSLWKHDGHEETVAAVERARTLARRDAEPTPEIVASLGAGWVAEEALSIAVYCALVARDFEHGVCLAVNHSGDSDSTGSIAGQLLGALHGDGAIPARWLGELELADVIRTLAEDWVGLLLVEPRADPHDWWDRYPGW